MTMHTKVSGTWREVTAPEVKVSGTWRAVQEGWVKVSGVWQQFFVAFEFSSTPSSSTNGFASGAAPSGTVSVAVSVTVSGGSPNYTFSWGRTGVTQGQTQNDIGTNPQTQAGTTHGITIQATNVPDAVDSINTWEVVVEDDDGNTITFPFTVTLDWSSTL